MKCPRCNSSSIVDRTDHQSSPTTNSHQTPLAARSQSSHLIRNPIGGQLPMRAPSLGMLAKHQSCPIPFQTPTRADWSSLDDSGLFGMSLDSHIVTPSATRIKTQSQVIEVGKCTSQQCGFRFCVSCWCDFRGGDHNCTIKESYQRQRSSEAVACSKQSKRNLRRLKVP